MLFLGKLQIKGLYYSNPSYDAYKSWHNGQNNSYVPPRGHIPPPEYFYGIGLKQAKDMWLSMRDRIRLGSSI